MFRTLMSGARRAKPFALAALIASVTPAYAHHPSGTMPAGVLEKGQNTIDVTTTFTKSEGLSDAELASLASRHVHAHDADYILATVFGLSYGVTDDLSLRLQLPFIRRDDIRSGSHVHGAGGVSNTAEHLGDVQGIGDASILATYRFLHEDQLGFEAAAIGGLKMPTGKTGLRHEGEKLEVEHQPGSGSWDPIFGLAVEKSFGLWTLNADAIYTLVTKGAQDVDLGDRAEYGVGVSYRVMGNPHNHHQDESQPHTHEALDLALRLEGEWSDYQKEDDESDRNSGGNEIFLTPGIRYTPDGDWGMHLSVGVPVVSNLNDGHADTAYKVMAGISRSF